MNPFNEQNNNASGNPSSPSAEFSSGSDSDNFVNGRRLRSSSSCSSLSESSINGAVRVFVSPLTTMKKVLKPKRKSLNIKRSPFKRAASERELELDNAEHLSGLMSVNAGRLPICE